VTSVTLALVNGRIRTGDARRPVADALAVAGDRLVLVGSSAEIRKLAPSGARVVDLCGASVGGVPADAVFRRGAVASFSVVTAGNAEVFRMIAGVVVLDALA
jgi:hypothetical protein